MSGLWSGLGSVWGSVWGSACLMGRVACMSLVGSVVVGQEMFLELPETIVYQCPLPVRVQIDTAGSDIIGAAVNVSVSSGARVVFFEPDPSFDMVLGHGVGGQALSGASFYYASQKQGLVNYGTIWVRQDNPVNRVSMDFLFREVGDQGDAVDIFVFGGKDILLSAEGSELVFVEGDCPYALPLEMSHDQGLENFDDKLQSVVSEAYVMPWWHRLWWLWVIVVLCCIRLSLRLGKAKRTKK